MAACNADLMEAAIAAYEAMMSATESGVWQGEPSNRHNRLRPGIDQLRNALDKAKGEDT